MSSYHPHYHWVITSRSAKCILGYFGPYASGEEAARHSHDMRRHDPSVVLRYLTREECQAISDKKHPRAVDHDSRVDHFLAPTLCLPSSWPTWAIACWSSRRFTSCDSSWAWTPGTPGRRVTTSC